MVCRSVSCTPDFWAKIAPPSLVSLVAASREQRKADIAQNIGVLTNVLQPNADATWGKWVWWMDYIAFYARPGVTLPSSICITWYRSSEKNLSQRLLNFAPAFLRHPVPFLPRPTPSHTPLYWSFTVSYLVANKSMRVTSKSGTKVVKSRRDFFQILNPTHTADVAR